MAVAAAVIILIAAIVIIKPLLRPAGGTNAMEVLELQGFSKEDLASVEEIYIVGNEAMDHDAAARYEDGDTSTIIYEVSDDEETTTPAGSISDLSGMGQLENLKVLQLSGQQIEDASELGKLKNLKTLILSCNPLSDLSALNDLPNLERVRISQSMAAMAAVLDDRIEVEFDD